MFQAIRRTKGAAIRAARVSRFRANEYGLKSLQHPRNPLIGRSRILAVFWDAYYWQAFRNRVMKGN